MMDLRLHIKQSIESDAGGNFYYQGSTVNTLSKTYGDLPLARRFPNWGNYIDITDDVADDIFKLKLGWSAARDNEGFITPTATTARRSASSNLGVNGEAYKMIKQWLISDVSAVLNTIDVRVIHYENGVQCGAYDDYVIKATDLTYCEDGICQLDIQFKQKDEAYNCIRSTLIHDNWQGWFQKQPANGKKHPRFSYCNEARPNGMMVMMWYITGMVTVPTLLVLIPIMFGLNGIFAVINVIIGIIKTIIAIVGGKDTDEVNWQSIPYFDFQAILDSYGAYFVESAGCGREFPAVLVRDYIYNVCAKCDVQVTAETAPLFFASSITYYANSGTVNQVNDYYNLTYLAANVKRGIRRFASLNALRALPNNTDFYQPENSVNKTLDMFLDDLMPVFNAEWVIKNNKLYINRKDWFRASDKAYILDFSKNGADRHRIVEGICYEWNEQKIPAYTEGVYSNDPADKPGNEALGQQNGLVSYGDASKIKIFEGIQDKKTQFGAARFRFDGAQTDYIDDAFQVVVNGSFLTPFMAGLMFDFVKPSFEEYADYALLIQEETIGLPKLLIWDGQSYENAKAAKFLSAYPITGYAQPDPNGQYNKNFDAWHGLHEPETAVRGSGLTLPPIQPGYYLVTDFSGAREYKSPALLVNYSMYFAPEFKGGLWDRFHWIDDPNKRAPALKNGYVKLEMCCELLQLLQVFGDGSATVLGEKIALPDGRDGVIAEIEADYDTQNTLGKHVIIKFDVYG